MSVRRCISASMAKRALASGGKVALEDIIFSYTVSKASAVLVL